jgi:RsiW-degrading membrane proteinase PrsW (M82 family)
METLIDYGRSGQVSKLRVRRATEALMQYGWVRFGAAGVVLWGVSVVVTLVTNDSILLPTVVLLGSFVVPATWVRRAVEHDHSDLPLTLVLQTFVCGGAAGVLSAALLETWLLRYVGQGLYVAVGLIEEAVKLAILWRVSRRLPDHSMINGLVLGATVGFGFAAFESSGYALNALYGATGTSVQSLVSTEAVRGLMAPVSHGLWTAIAGAVLFRESHGGRLRGTRRVIGAYGFVSFLHAAWDLAPAFALSIILYASGKGWTVNLLGPQQPLNILIHGQVGHEQALDDLLLMVNGAIGLITVHRYRLRGLATQSHPKRGQSLQGPDSKMQRTDLPGPRGLDQFVEPAHHIERRAL